MADTNIPGLDEILAEAEAANTEAAEGAQPPPSTEDISSAETEQTEQKCPTVSAIIPIVYPLQGISMPRAAIIQGFNDAGVTNFNMDATVAASVAKAEAIRQRNGFSYPVTLMDNSYKLSGVGHAGVCIIVGSKKKAYYYEYGRYGGTAEGRVQKGKYWKKPINVDFENCQLTASSEQTILKQLLNTNDKTGDIQLGLWLPVSDANAQKAQSTADALNGSPWGGVYDLSDHNCYSFSKYIASLGGWRLSQSIKAGLEVQMNENAGWMEKGKAMFAPSFEVPSFSMQAERKKNAKHVNNGSIAY